MHTVIRTQSELEALKRRDARYDLREIKLELPGNAEAVRDAERTINRSLRACGCEIGAIFLIVGMVILGVMYWLQSPLENGVSAQNICFGVVFLLTVTFAGKMIGLALAEWKLRAAIRKLVF